MISYISLSTATLEKTLPVSTDVIDVVLAGNGYLYVFPRTGQHTEILSIHIATALETRTGGVYEGTVAKLHPGGKVIYGADRGGPSDIEKYNIANGVAEYRYDSPYHGDYPMCGDLWISEDGLRIFTKCGNVFRSSEIREQDMRYNGSLSKLNSVEHLSHSSSANKVIVIPEIQRSSPMELQIIDMILLTTATILCAVTFGSRKTA